MASFSSKLQAAVEASGMTVPELALRCGVTERLAADWLSRRRRPLFEHIQLLSDAIGVSMDVWGRDSNIFAFKLRLLFALRRITQSDLAQRIGIRQGKLSRLSNGLSQPTPDELRELSEAFGVPVEFFLYLPEREAVNFSAVRKGEWLDPVSG